MTTKKKITIILVKTLKPLIKNYVPRWLIFTIDLSISFIALHCAYFLVSTIDSSTSIYNPFAFKWQLWAILGVQAFYFYLFKSYSGLVRYSSFKDTIKQFQVTFFCIASLWLINRIYYYTYSEKLILDAGVIIYGFIAFSMLFFFRVAVKKAYQVLNSSKNTTNAYILGTSRNDVAMAEGLISENSDKFNIIGFVDNHAKNKHNRIFNLPIYNLHQLKKSKNIAKIVIVSEDKLLELNASKSNLLNQLLDLKLKIFKLPKIEGWDHQASTKNLKRIKIEDLLQRPPIKLDNEKLFKLYKNKTILVTGAAGSIGSEIVKQLVAFQPKKIILLDQAETPLHELVLLLDKKYPSLDYEKIIANVRSKKRLKKVFELHNPEVVFHGAAYKHVPMMEHNPIEALSVNFVGTRNLAELAIEYKIERFVFVSTDKAVNPTNIMGATKRSAELYIQLLSTQLDNPTTFITTRFGNVLGSNGSVIPHFKKQIEENGPITVTHPEITRFFMTIDEACQLVLEAGAMGNGGEIYVFDMGKPIKIIDLALHMIRLTGLTPYKDIKIKFTGLRPGEKLYEELLADKEKTLPTHHKKILIAQETHNFDHSKIGLLSDLLRSVKNNECEESIVTLKKLVPEYYKPEEVTHETCKKPDLSSDQSNQSKIVA